MKIRLMPNSNSEYEMRGKTYYEQVEIGRLDGRMPWTLAHVDLFHDPHDIDLYERLARGEQVIVELVVSDE
jgi:hypothetical protein